MAMRARPTLLTTLLLLLLAAGCASATGGRNPFQAPGASRIHIKVQNDNFYDATIWAVVNGARQQRLGTVTGKQNADFSMAWDTSRTLQLEIDLMTGNLSCRTNPLTVDPGDDLELQITADFGQMRGCS
jgi:hypothetical protein